MNVTSLRYTCPFLFAVAAAAQDTTTVVDTLFPGAVAGDRGPLLTRLVDDLTGEPIAGADVFLIGERNTPIAGEFWWVHRGKSDAEGFVRIDRPNGDRDWGWWVVRHPDRGTVSGDDHEPVLRIGRTFDVPVRILDWMGRPAPGAQIGLCGGCGHSPDLVNATADSNGIAVLRGIDPHQDIADLYVQHPGLDLGYESVDWYPGNGPFDLQCDFGPAMSGKVVDHRGMPVANAFVGNPYVHRGPWTRTTANGGFLLLGASSAEGPHQVVLADGRKIHFPGAGSHPVTLQLPDLADPEAHYGTIDVPELEVPEVATREVRVEVLQAPSAKMSFWAKWPHRTEQGEAEPGHVLVPRTGPFVLEVDDDDDDDDPRGGGSRTFPFTDASIVGDPLVVSWTPNARVIGRAVDAAGAPLWVGARWRSSWSGTSDHEERNLRAFSDGRFDFANLPGLGLLELVPDRQELRPRFVWVTVPEIGRPTLDLGAIVFGGPPQLAVVDEKGLPLPGATVGFARAGLQRAGSVLGWPLAADGTWQGPDLRAGDAIEVQADESSLPFRTVLVGDGPWTITPPRGELHVQIVDPDGQPIEGGITFRDRFVEANGEATLRGLPVGQVRLHVGARGHRSAVVETAATPTVRTVRVTLPPR